ncbi:DUF7079 family protein [Hymenobacter sp.]|jgi:hypothetical protein|uniref:DUF7079 family protein n=1 Tax=Hymenobacter sp. TaxID=1898978 RepID=UPI003BB94DF4
MRIQELERRRLVWVALAKLYLDTELQDSDFQQIAAEITASGLTWHEIQGINYDEVGPALWSNLLSIAGEWEGWDPEWLTERITSHYTGPATVC